MQDLSWVVISALVTGVTGLLYLWHRRLSRTFQNINIRGPKPSFVLGNLRIFSAKQGMVNLTNAMTAQYGKVFGMFLGCKPILFVLDLDVIHEILSRKFNAFPDRGIDGMLAHKPWDSSLLMLTGDRWKQVRARLTPTFSTSKLKKIASAIQRVVVNLDKHVQEIITRDEPVDLKELCGCFSMDAIANAAFGVQLDSLANPDHPFITNGLILLNRNEWIWKISPFPILVEMLKMVGITQPSITGTRFFISFIKAALQDRRNDKTNQKYNDFLQLLVEAEREDSQGIMEDETVDNYQLRSSTQGKRGGLTEDEILSNAISILMGGYDTISSTMSLALFCLAANPQYLHKVQEELDHVLGQDDLVTYEKVSQLTYLGMCINETIRIYPVNDGTTRQCGQDVEVAGGYHVPRGMTVFIPVISIHMDPDLWPNPEHFDPERFTPEQCAKRHPCAYLPFGYGPRYCIAMRFSMLKIRLAIASLLRRYTPILCDKSVYPPRMTGFKRIVSRDGLWVKFRRRPEK